MSALCSNPPHVAYVPHIDQVAYRVVSAEHGRLPVLPADEEKARWKRLIGRFGLDVSEAFLGREWSQVVLAQAITSRRSISPRHVSAAGAGSPPRQREL
ncbi:MAG: hypothetical protein ACRDSN_16705, partial [Pseudonocardiaceae bacterium]